MEPRIEEIEEKKLIGMRLSMSLANNKMGQLWGGFMSRRNEIASVKNSNLISMVVYSPDHFINFNIHNTFERHAAVEVGEAAIVPVNMETFVIPAGTYAVFDYKGMSNDISIFNYIFGTWLPQSKYLLDKRPHFEVLGEKYKNNDPNSEEEIWIPIKIKAT